MKLYLSSDGSEDRASLMALVGAGRHAGLVLNARDGREDRQTAWPREEADLRTLGFDVVEVDLRSYFGRTEDLRSRLATLDLLWVVGGNAFVLARAMDASGFAAAAAVPLSSGQLTYAGFSAGVCVTGPDFEGIHLMDRHDVVPDGYPVDARAVTLGWVPWRVVPHWDSARFSTAAERAVQHLLHTGLAFRTLRDGHAVVVDGETTSVI